MDRKPYREENIYYPYDLEICPICGGAIKHPYTGNVTSEQMEEDSNTCIWIECVDENDMSLGYHPICNNIHPYTLKSENHKYVHYDMIELVNSFPISIEERIKKIRSYIEYANPTLAKDQYDVLTENDKITGLRLAENIDLIGLTLGFDGEHITIDRG